MSTYDNLLQEAKLKAEAYRSTAKEFIPKMYNALREEDPNITPQDARDRIEKDCLGIIWEKRTILDALPSEAKDPEKQKAGRLGQKKRDSAAFSAARSCEMKKEIIIDTQGKPIHTKLGPSPAQLLSTALLDNSDPPLSKNNDNQSQNDDNLTEEKPSINLSKAEICFSISKENYQEIIHAILCGYDCFYLIFNRIDGLLLRTEFPEA